jgi:hypothetical protein
VSSVAKTVAVIDLKSSSAARDAAWWRQQPPAERIAALEAIRREYHLWKYGAEPRFQRVYRIAER